MKKPVSIITGAAKGIGKAIATRMVRDGFFVVAADQDAEAGVCLEKELGRGNCKIIQCNISSESEIRKLFSEALTINGNIEVVVNNAGIIRDKKIWDMSMDEFDEVISVNLKGTWMMCREAARVMMKQERGRIVNIASRAWLGNPGQTNYAASKAGVVALTRVLALELGKYNVLVNAVAPGLIDTPMTQQLRADIRNRLIEAQPTKEMGKPEDVANVVAFLAHEDTKFITGQLLYVDGGKNIGANLF
jgi:NAD(P)-dependent dehydrogenase (short-subunit alcohol dehydrogenase family)